MNGNLTAKLSKATLKYIEMFHSSKNPIKIDYVVIIKILISDKFPGGKGDKFFVRCKIITMMMMMTILHPIKQQKMTGYLKKLAELRL